MVRACCFVVAFVLFLRVSQVGAQDKKPEKPTPGDEMIYKYLCAETDKLAQKFLDGAKTLEEWQKKRPRLYQEYMDMLGLWPIPEKTPLKATVTGTLERHGVVIEKVHFQSKPGLYVTGNLYRPKASPTRDKASPTRERGEKLPTILYVCGHSNKGRDGAKSAYQDHGLWFANNGYICLVIDTLQLGEIPGVHHGTYGRPWLHLKSWGDFKFPTPLKSLSPGTPGERGRGEGAKPAKLIDLANEGPRWWWHSLGYTPAGVEAWNGIRAIDYLLTRPDVDPDKIGVTGISGGGAATFWIAAADERVKVAVPVSGMSDLESYVKNKVVNGHCDCMFLHNTYQWDWTTIAALVAPRPLLFANSDNDPIFPMDGNRRVIAKLRKLYDMYQKPELVDDYVSVGGHAYRPDLRVAIYKFINKHLKGDTKSKVEETRYDPIPGPDLRVFPTDADIPKDAINHRIDETFIPRAQVKLPEKGKFEEWKRDLIYQLRLKVFRSGAAKVDRPTEHVIKFTDGGTSRLLSFGGLFGVETTPLFKDGKTELLWVASACDVANKQHTAPFRVAHRTRVLFTNGSDLSAMHWTKKSPPNYVERSHILLGQSIDGNAVRDIFLTSRYLAEKEGASLKAIGCGPTGVLLAYASTVFGVPYDEVIVIDPPKSHMEGPHFLNVLRVLDIPEALGLLAPRPLTIIGGDPKAFERTAEIYRLAGAADKLTFKKAVP